MSPLAIGLAAWIVNGALLAPVFTVALAWVRRRDWIPPHWAALAAAAGVALGGYVAFWIYFFSPAAGVFFSVALIFGCAARCWRALNSGPAEKSAGGRSEVLPVAILAIGIGLWYMGAAYLPTPAHPNPSFYERTANRFLPGLPCDNSIPFLLADAVYQGPCPKVLFAEWLPSDRPPLQSGWDLLTRPVTDSLGIDAQVASGTAGVWMQLIWVAAVYGLFRSMTLRAASAAALTGGLSFTGFFLLHTVYTWPKLAGGALVCGAWALMVLETSDDQAVARRRFALAGLWAGLGWVSHGGVAFGLLALAPWALMALFKGHFRPWVGAGAVIVLIALPWSAFQKYYAPPGNRLVKWHIGGQIAVDSRGTWQTIRENYAALGWRGALHNRVTNIKMLADGKWPDPRHPGSDPGIQRAMEFFFIFRATGLWLAGAAALGAVAWLRGREKARKALASLAIWTAATLAVWIALMFEARIAEIHRGSFTVPMALLCLFAAGLRLAGKAVFAVVFVAQAALFAFVWLPPGPDYGKPWDPAALVALLVGAAVPVVFVAKDLLKASDSPAA